MPTYSHIRVVAPRPVGIERVLHAIDVANDLVQHAQSNRTVNARMSGLGLVHEYIEAERETEAVACIRRATRLLAFAVQLLTTAEENQP